LNDAECSWRKQKRCNQPNGHSCEVAVDRYVNVCTIVNNKHVLWLQVPASTTTRPAYAAATVCLSVGPQVSDRSFEQCSSKKACSALKSCSKAIFPLYTMPHVLVLHMSMHASYNIVLCTAAVTIVQLAPIWHLIEAKSAGDPLKIPKIQRIQTMQ
jgi:hypothetical protein